LPDRDEHLPPSYFTVPNAGSDGCSEALEAHLSLPYEIEPDADAGAFVRTSRCRGSSQTQPTL